MRREYGISANTPIKQKTIQEISSDGTTIRIERMVDSDAVQNSTPALDSALPGNAAFRLRLITTETQTANLSKVTLVYEAVTSTGSLPPNTIVENGSVEEIDIRLHPRFSEWAEDWDNEKEAFKAGTTKYGITAYKVGCTTVTKTNYFTSQPGSPHTRLGKLESPGGGYGSQSNWLVIGARRQRIGNFWSLELTYLFSDKEYNSDIYN